MQKEFLKNSQGFQSCNGFIFYDFQKYLDSAEADKQNYEREMSAYKKTEAYKSMNKRKKKNHAHSNQQSGPLDMNISGATGNSSFGHNVSGGSAMNMMNRPTHLNHDTGMEIPIFTEEFLDHNKGSCPKFRPLHFLKKPAAIFFFFHHSSNVNFDYNSVNLICFYHSNSIRHLFYGVHVVRHSMMMIFCDFKMC